MPTYPGFELEVEALREKPEIIAEASVPDTLEHLCEVVEGLDRPPIIMGHSFGGTFTQLLVNRGLGAAAVTIDSAPPEGVRVNPPSQLKSLFPILNNTLLGLSSADRNQLDLFRMHKAGRVTEFVKLRLPGALPHIFAGLRISAGLSVIGAIVGEFIIGSGGEQGGLGVKVIFAQIRLQTNLLFAEVLAATLLGFAFFMIVSWTGNRLLRDWHESAMKIEE